MLARFHWQTGRFHSTLPSPDHQHQLKPAPAPIFGAHYWPFSILQCDLVLPSLQVTREALLHCWISFLSFTAFGEETCQGFLKIQTQHASGIPFSQVLRDIPRNSSLLVQQNFTLQTLYWLFSTRMHLINMLNTFMNSNTGDESGKEHKEQKKKKK